MLKSNLIFPLTGFIIGLLLAICQLSKFDSSFIYIFLSIYGVMFLLATQYTENLKVLFFSTFIPSILASLPCLWLMDSNYDIPFSTILLAIISTQALNAFHLNYHKNLFKLSYETLFQAVWDSMVQLFITFIFAILCFSILFLAASLFKLVQLTFLDTLLSKEWFELWSQALFISTGLLICAQTRHIIQNIRSILLLICKYLFIPLSIIGLLFIMFSVITIITNPLSLKHEYLFLSISFLSVIFINGIYQDGQINSPYPKLLSIICQLFLIITPIFTILAILALVFTKKNNILDNSIHTDDFLFLINVALLLIYNISYTVIAVLNRKPWLKPIEKTNIILAFVLIITSIATSNPLILKKLQAKSLNLHKATATRPIISLFNPPMPDSTSPPLDVFTVVGLSWETTLKNAIVLGTNNGPIYFCRPKNKTNFGGMLRNNKCEWIDDDNTIQISNSYTIFSGKEDSLKWLDYKDWFSPNNIYAEDIVRLDYKTQMPKAICRSIYQNHIVVGTTTKYSTCVFIFKNKIIHKSDSIEYLYLK